MPRRRYDDENTRLYLENHMPATYNGLHIESINKGSRSVPYYYIDAYTAKKFTKPHATLASRQRKKRMTAASARKLCEKNPAICSITFEKSVAKKKKKKPPAIFVSHPIAARRKKPVSKAIVVYKPPKVLSQAAQQHMFQNTVLPKIMRLARQQKPKTYNVTIPAKPKQQLLLTWPQQKKPKPKTKRRSPRLMAKKK